MSDKKEHTLTADEVPRHSIVEDAAEQMGMRGLCMAKKGEIC